MTTSPAQVLSVVQLCKRYGATVAVDGLSFEVGRREIVGLLGSNGAGKTTTINMVLGLREPSMPGARALAAWRASFRGVALNVSEDGPITVYERGATLGRIG